MRFDDEDEQGALLGSLSALQPDVTTLHRPHRPMYRGPQSGPLPRTLRPFCDIDQGFEPPAAGGIANTSF